MLDFIINIKNAACAFASSKDNKKQIDVSFVSFPPASCPNPHYINNLERIVHYLDKENKAIHVEKKHQIGCCCKWFDNDQNLLTASDFGHIRKVMESYLDYLFGLGYETITFTPVDWKRFLATKRLLKSYYKSKDYRVTESGYHYIKETCFNDPGDFDGKITITKEV